MKIANGFYYVQESSSNSQQQEGFIWCNKAEESLSINK